jgi:hypothetical protein
MNLLSIFRTPRRQQEPTPPEWTRFEFALLVDHPQLDDRELAQHLLGRTAEEIAAVRQGVHAFHGNQDTFMLSRMMLRCLEAWSGSNRITCAVCQQRF